ncbi:MAG: FAD-dependent oxidoreductase [Gammaproteobacteria bacterium]|nr:FAD-dependent oxidoreductase [Gammaproteobacteria bacterium]
MTHSPHVVVIGAGWAGLSAAAELCERQIKLSVLEASSFLGGRARGIRFGDDRVDNGQHLLIGAYHEVLRQLTRAGVDPDSSFERIPLKLVMRSATSSGLSLSLPRWLPAPLHLLWSLLNAQGLGLAERLSALRFAIGLGLRGFRLQRDLPLAELLARSGQLESVVDKLWAPLCLATLNTPITEASSQLFLNVLRDSFSRRRGDSELLLPRGDLGAVFPEPLADYIKARGGEIRTGARVTALHIVSGRIQGVQLGEERLDCDAVILATAPQGANKLLSPIPSLAQLAGQLDALDASPITTVYLRYANDVDLDPPLQGVLQAHSQWVMSRRSSAQPKLLSVVISGDGPHMALSREHLADTVRAELSAIHPHLERSIECLVIREKQATFLATPDATALRPGHITPVEGLYLSGDYTHGPYPATLEGAVRSGVQCARLLLRQVSNE